MKVTVRQSWAMGHRLQRHDGKCKGLHGHTYTAVAVFEGEVVNDREASAFGMLADFSALKGLLRARLADWDHALMLEDGDPAATAVQGFARVVLVPHPPTAELIAAHVLGWLQEMASQLGVRCESVTVFESAETSAEATAR